MVRSRCIDARLPLTNKTIEPGHADRLNKRHFQETSNVTVLLYLMA
jgi:hypothetical protein